MKKPFQDLKPDTRNEIIVRTMDKILEEKRMQEPKSDAGWLKLYNKVYDRLRKKNIEVENWAEQP